MQMCLLCPEVALDGFRHEQLEETAEIMRLQRARRVAISHAYSQAVTTFQVLSPPFMRQLFSADYLCRARWAIKFCARTHRLKGARRILRSPCPPARLQYLSGSYVLPSYFNRDLFTSFAERRGLSRFVQGPTALQEQRGSLSPAPTRKP